MSNDRIEREVFEGFKMAIETLKILLRSKNFILKVCKIDNYHDGESIWRKFGEIKRVVFNDITKLYMKNLPGGQLR